VYLLVVRVHGLVSHLHDVFHIRAWGYGGNLSPSVVGNRAVHDPMANRWPGVVIHASDYDVSKIKNGATAIPADTGVFKGEEIRWGVRVRSEESDQR
jgi:hypothetical protein